MNSKQTTVTINQTTSKKLERLAATNGISKKEFIDQALDYFEKYGINPTQDETPLEEMDRIRKRQDQVIAFLRKQEKNILEPSLLGIVKADESMRYKLNKFEKLLAELSNNTNESLDKHTLKLLEYTKVVGQDIVLFGKANTAKTNQLIEDMIKNQSANQAKTEKGLLAIAQYLDKKSREGLLDKVSNLFG